MDAGRVGRGNRSDPDRRVNRAAHVFSLEPAIADDFIIGPDRSALVLDKQAGRNDGGV